MPSRAKVLFFTKMMAYYIHRGVKCDCNVVYIALQEKTACSCKIYSSMSKKYKINHSILFTHFKPLHSQCLITCPRAILMAVSKQFRNQIKLSLNWILLVLLRQTFSLLYDELAGNLIFVHRLAST